jgi:hypothetical protein
VSRRERLLLRFATAAVVRLIFFTGHALGDDVFYASQAMAFADKHGWPPAPYHWYTRIGLTGPTAAVIALWGPVPAAFVAIPFAASLASVWLSFRVAMDVADLEFATMVGVLHAFYPLELIYATHLFPDVPVGVLCAVSLYAWWRSLRADDPRWALASGALLGTAYLVRETAFMCAPVFVAFLLYYRSPRLVRLVPICILPFAAIMAAECLLYWVSAGDMMYRWRSMALQQDNPANISLVAASAFGGGFWSDPLLMTVSSQDFGPFLLVAAAGVWRARASRAATVVALWLAVGFLWTYYGTTVPWRWMPLQRDPRYAAFLTTPAVIMAAYALAGLQRRARTAAVVCLALLGLACAAADQGASIRAPHAALLKKGYGATLSLEPLEFYGAWWESGLSAPPPFSCASGVGRESLVALFEALGSARIVDIESTRYFAFSPDRRPDLLPRMLASGWTPDSVIPAHPILGRKLIGHLLQMVPSQVKRAERLLNPPGLIVLMRAGAESGGMPRAIAWTGLQQGAGRDVCRIADAPRAPAGS